MLQAILLSSWFFWQRHRIIGDDTINDDMHSYPWDRQEQG
jgi:hypothetical protein